MITTATVHVCCDTSGCLNFFTLEWDEVVRDLPGSIAKYGNEWESENGRHFCAACVRGYPVEPDDELEAWPASGELAHRLADLFACEPTADEIVSCVERVLDLAKIRAARIEDLEGQLNEFRNSEHGPRQLLAARNTLALLGQLAGCDGSGTFEETGQAVSGLIRSLRAENDDYLSTIRRVAGYLQSGLSKESLIYRAKFLSEDLPRLRRLALHLYECGKAAGMTSGADILQTADQIVALQSRVKTLEDHSAALKRCAEALGVDADDDPLEVVYEVAWLLRDRDRFEAELKGHQSGGAVTRIAKVLDCPPTEDDIMRALAVLRLESQFAPTNLGRVAVVLGLPLESSFDDVIKEADAMRVRIAVLRHRVDSLERLSEADYKEIDKLRDELAGCQDAIKDKLEGELSDAAIREIDRLESELSKCRRLADDLRGAAVDNHREFSEAIEALATELADCQAAIESKPESETP